MAYTEAVPTHNGERFDIVATYRRLLRDDPELTMPVAAIEALVLALIHSDATTVSETLDVLEASTTTLKQAIPNPISLSAGTDLFQRYLVTTLPHGDFQSIRSHLLSNGRLFVARAKASREKIASFGRHFVRDGATVLTNGGSRVVGALLRHAADGSHGSIRFRVIYVLSSTTKDAEGQSTVRDLRARGVPVATIPESAVAYSLGKITMVLVGAEGVVENGGVISRLGTYQMGLLAKSAKKPFYVVAESHKFVRLYPLSQYDLPIDQRLIDFISTENGKEESAEPVEEEDEGVEMSSDSDKMRKQKPINGSQIRSPLKDAVDFTPPELISGIITESGVLTPSAVSEELIKIWF